MKVPPYLSIRNPVFTFMRKPLIKELYLSLYRYFSHHRKSHSIIQRTKLLDFFIRSGFLMQEIIGRKSDNDKIIFSIFLIQLLQLGVLGSETAFRCHIDYQYFLTLERGKWQVLPVNSLDRKVIKTFCCAPATDVIMVTIMLNINVFI